MATITVKNGNVDSGEYMNPFGYHRDAPTLPDGTYETFSYYTRDPNVGDDEIDRLTDARKKSVGEVNCEGIVVLAIPTESLPLKGC